MCIYNAKKIIENTQKTCRENLHDFIYKFSATFQTLKFSLTSVTSAAGFIWWVRQVKPSLDPTGIKQLQCPRKPLIVKKFQEAQIFMCILKVHGPHGGAEGQRGSAPLESIGIWSNMAPINIHSKRNSIRPES